MSQDLLAKLRRIGRKLEPAKTVSESSNEQPPEASAIEQEGPSEASGVLTEHTTAPKLDKVPRVAGFVQNEIYYGHVSPKEAMRGPSQNPNLMIVDVDGMEGRVLVKDRRKWRPRKPITLIFSGRMDGPYPVFGYKPEPFDPR
jgi:hypothetical protein